MDEKDEVKARKLVTFDPNVDEDQVQEHELRYEKDPVEALPECRDRFQRNEVGYHELRRLLVATLYAVALRLLADPDAKDRFFTLDYHQKPWRRYVRTPRDFFREVFKYVTGEGNKAASKYAKVLWLLYEADVHVEFAASTISCSGGIEKMAREGIYKPVYVDPRDVGDGMDAYGNKIHYPDGAPAAKEQEEDEPPVEVPNAELLFDYVDGAPEPEGIVNIVARYGQGLGRPVVQFLRVEPAPASSEVGPPPSAILPLEMSREMRERFTDEGGIWWVRVELQVTEDAPNAKFVATKMVKDVRVKANRAPPRPGFRGARHEAA